MAKYSTYLRDIVLVSPAGSATGQVLQSTGPASAPAWTTVNKASVGLSNVDNTSDVNKPVSTSQSTALALKAPLASPTFTGAPLAPTAAVGTNTVQLANMAAVQAQAFGSLQALTNLTASRVSGTTYTNATSKPIVIYVIGVTTAANGFMSGAISGVQLASASHPLVGSGFGLSMIIPPGATYAVSVGSATISSWYEYR